MVMNASILSKPPYPAVFALLTQPLPMATRKKSGSEMENPETSIQACLDRLNIGYADMMLLHHPDKNDVKAYKALEQFVKDGKMM